METSIKSARRPYRVQMVLKQDEFSDPVSRHGVIDANNVENFYTSIEGDTCYVEMESGSIHHIEGTAEEHEEAGLMEPIKAAKTWDDDQL